MPALILGKNGPFKLSRQIADYPDGIILPVDKPYRWTSADVIRKMKYAACRHFSKKNLKVGHAGTLDPLATGVLLVCIAEATKLAETLQKHDKEYLAGISFGATTPSYDLEKEVDCLYSHSHVTGEAVAAALPGFIGVQEQVAPLFSAKLVDGVRAYEIARRLYKRAAAEAAGGPVAFDHSDASILRRQIINISEVELVRFRPSGAASDRVSGGGEIPGADSNGRNARINVADTSSLHLPHAEIRIVCSKGTYIRAFARDLGEALDSGAHLDSLCRTRSGDFKVSEALSVDEAAALFVC